MLRAQENTMKMKPHLLVVDDSPMIQALLRDYLEMEGYQVTCENSADAALNYLKGQKPGVAAIISDLVMPGISGVDFVKHATQDYHIPVIVITAFGTVYPETELIRAGASAVIHKPFLLSTLAAHLEKVREPGK